MRTRCARRPLGGDVVRPRRGDAACSACRAGEARRRGRGQDPPREPHPLHPDRPEPGARVRHGADEDAGRAMTAFRLSTTLFALTNEWLSRQYTFEGLVDRAAELGLGPALELIGFQSIRGFPAVDAE